MDYICSHWKYTKVTAHATTKIGMAVRCLPSSAIFITSDPTYPVAWILCHPFGHMGHWFTVEGHRRKGLGTLVLKDLCCKLLAEGYTPELESEDQEAIAVIKSVGFVEFMRSRWLVSINHSHLYNHQ